MLRRRLRVRPTERGNGNVADDTTTGTIRCWGINATTDALGYGHTFISIGAYEEPWTTGDVDIGGNAVALSTGDNHTCALMDKGAVRC